MISGFCHEVDEICALLGYNAASTGNFLPTFRVNLTVPSSGFKNPKRLSFGFLNHEDGTDSYSETFSEKLSLLTA
jgi:hypothetical protein